MTDDWCSVCDCPLTSKKFPILSSSFSSTITGSLSSSSHSSSSDEERRRYRPLRSSAGHPNDYYTSKRIDQLHERMDDIQIFSFVKFVNYHLSLKKSKFQINDIGKDLSNGHALIDLIEIFSSTKLKREHGQTRFHSLANVRHVLDYLQKHTEHVNISPQDIVSGNRKQILALLWMIMKLFDFPSFRLTNKNCFRENTLLGCGQDRSVLLQWLNQIVNQTLPSEPTTPIRDFYLQTWLDGYYFSHILKYLVPLSVKYITVQTFDYLRELDQLKLYDTRSFHVCLNLCNHCFNTVTIIDCGDQTERSLFRYFTELQQNVFILLKSNQIGKLIQNNPYTKQILETVGPTVHVSNVSQNNEQYLICMEGNRGAQNSLSNRATILEDVRPKSVQHETLSSDSHMINGRDKVPELVEETTSYQPLVAIVDVEQHTIEDEQIATTIENHARGKDEEPSIEGRERHLFATSKDLIDTDRHSEQLTATTNEEEEKEKAQSFVVSNHENEHEKLDQSIVIAQVPKQVIPVVLQPTPNNEEAEHPNAANIDKVTIHKARQLFTPSAEIEESTVENEKLEQTTKLQDEIEQPVRFNHKESEPLPLISEETQLTTVKIEESQPSSIEWKEDEDQKSTREYETLPQSAASTQENEPPTTNSEPSKTEDQNIPTTTAENEQVAHKSESVIAKTDSDHQMINLTELNNTSSIEDEQVVPSNQSDCFGHTNMESKSPSSLESTGSDQEHTIVSVENNHHPIVVNEERKDATPSAVSQEENKTPITSARKPKQPTVKQEKLNRSPAQQMTENKPSSYLANNTTTVVTNHSVTTDGESKQFTTEKPQQSSTSSGKTIKILSEDNFPIAKSRKEERSVAPRQTSQSTVTANVQFNSSTATNPKPTVATKTSTQIGPSIEEKRCLTASSEQRPTIREPAASTTTKGNKYSDIVAKQATKESNGPAQNTSPLKSPEQYAASKRSVTSSLNEESKQSFTSIAEAKSIPVTSAIKKSEESKVVLEKEGQIVVSATRNASASTMSNEDVKQPSKRNKKSRRANAKKGKATNSSVNIDSMPEHDEQIVKPAEISSNITEDGKSSQSQSEILISTSNSDRPLKNQTSPKSNTSRSRKNKKKKTVATTSTTLIEKSSPSRASISTTPNRNLFVVIKQFIHDPKSVAFKCIFILLCLCFSIIILVLSHK